MKEETEVPCLNPHEDKIIGIIDNDIYFKPEHGEYIVITSREEYLKTLNLYLDNKKDYCDRAGHFCGTYGEVQAEQYTLIKEGFVIREGFEVEDDGENDGFEFRDITYPLYYIDNFSDQCDMEHG